MGPDASKAVFAMEPLESTLIKTEMESRKLKDTAKCLREGIDETITYLLDDYSVEHRKCIRAKNMIERPIWEIRRATLVVGGFPCGRNAQMLINARIRHIIADDWSIRRYFGCVPSPRHHTGSELTIVPMTSRKSLRKTSGIIFRFDASVGGFPADMVLTGRRQPIMKNISYTLNEILPQKFI
ncbi:hypothetical protein BPY_22560 [Bifidobacterium psychraerophilum]